VIAPLGPARIFDSPTPDGPFTDDVQGLAAALAGAPYLRRLAERREGLVARLTADGAEAMVAAALADARHAGQADTFEAAMARLRKAKAETHLALACLDLSRTWPLARITGALSNLADAGLTAAVEAAAKTLTASGEMRPVGADEPGGPIPGLILIAMGKHGARELNYSSDIDFTVFYDRARLPVADGREPQRLALRIAQLLVKALEEVTIEGYVFRTDLRLRPDPGSTPVAVNVQMAENYYQSIGQNWERAAFIKARAAAGDVAAGEAFLASLTPFIWRRHLDYAAIEDIRSIKRQILASAGRAELDDPIFDVKLGRGGIRDIELFVQTQQLILGGRNPDLRRRETLGALDVLTEIGAVAADDRDALAAAYDFLRGVEHRVQMLRDEQTHKIPADAEERSRLAALCGFATREDLEAALLAVRKEVAEIDRRLFKDDGGLADPLGSLVFTGVEDDPDTIETLKRLGFGEPSRVAETVRGWHHARIRATRSERARELLTALMPALLRAVSESGEPDAAFARFHDFLAALPAGVQVLSLFQAQPRLLTDLCAAFALAPGLSATLSRAPGVIDSMLEPLFVAPLGADPPRRRRDLMLARTNEAGGFEAAMNAVRRLSREETFRIDMQTLLRRADCMTAGAAYSDLAEACVAAMALAAEEETTRRFGPAPGAYAILALGKFGGRELSHGADLDLMLLYDAPEGTGASDYFTRLTQRLVAAISSPTEAGILYETDMALRPSGAKGPAAVRLSSFRRYYREEAWTWELIAMTRLRAVAGQSELGAIAEAEIAATLALPRDRTALLGDVAAMRARMDKERPGKGLWDLKLDPGGLVDVEFIAQALTLAAAPKTPGIVRPNTAKALAALAAAGELDGVDAASLASAWRLYSDLQHLLRVAGASPFEPAAASARLKALMAETGGVQDFAALQARLADAKRTVRALFLRLIGASDGNVRPPR
jgi:glutamate-ammonia-ligase adenylyltransferase